MSRPSSFGNPPNWPVRLHRSRCRHSRPLPDTKTPRKVLHNPRRDGSPTNCLSLLTRPPQGDPAKPASPPHSPFARLRSKLYVTEVLRYDERVWCLVRLLALALCVCSLRAAQPQSAPSPALVLRPALRSERNAWPPEHRSLPREERDQPRQPVHPRNLRQTALCHRLTLPRWPNASPPPTPTSPPTASVPLWGGPIAYLGQNP